MTYKTYTPRVLNVFCTDGAATATLQQHFADTTITRNVTLDNQKGAVVSIPYYEDDTDAGYSATAQQAIQAQASVGASINIKPAFPPAIEEMQGFALPPKESPWVLDTGKKTQLLPAPGGR